MFFAGIRSSDRIRGMGWLDCPNCHEHAAQDVVDEMSFLALLFYRFTPVRRRRVLACSRCGYRRWATRDELKRLETRGQPIRRAWLVPFGLIPFVAIALIAVLVGASSGSALAQKLSFRTQSAQPIAPIQFDGPAAWNYNPDDTSDPPKYTVADPGGRTEIIFHRIATGGSLPALLGDNWKDEVGILSTGYPSAPCKTVNATVAGLRAVKTVAQYQQSGEASRQLLFVFSHDGVGYVLTYVALGNDAIKDLDDLAKTVNDSIKFTAKEKPSPSPSPSGSESAASPGASPSPSVGASPSASPEASASASPSASPTASNEPGCSVTP